MLQVFVRSINNNNSNNTNLDLDCSKYLLRYNLKTLVIKEFRLGYFFIHTRTIFVYVRSHSNVQKALFMKQCLKSEMLGLLSNVKLKWPVGGCIFLLSQRVVQTNHSKQQ